MAKGFDDGLVERTYALDLNGMEPYLGSDGRLELRVRVRPLDCGAEALAMHGKFVEAGFSKQEAHRILDELMDSVSERQFLKLFADRRV
jgi:hypothetical protein